MALQYYKPSQSPALKIAQEARGLWEKGEFTAAIQKLEEAATREPKNPEICLGLGKACGARFDYEGAKKWFDRALALAPDSTKVHFQAALDWNELNRVQATVECLEKVLRLQPGHQGALLMLAEIHEHQHQLETAKTELTQLRNFDSNNPGASFLLAKIARREGNLTSAESHLRELLAGVRVSSDLLFRTWHELGQVLDAQGRYDEAMDAFEKGKALRLPKAQPLWDTLARVHQHAKAMLAQADPKQFQEWKKQATDLGPPLPFALLCGHPRAGTTLMEQILDAHPRVISSEETRILHDEAYLPLCKNHTPTTTVMDVLRGSDSAAVREARARYKRCTEAFLGEPIGFRLLLDKNPAFNILLVPIARLIPEAKLLIAVRDPRDVILSCFMQAFSLNPISSAYLSLEKTVDQYLSAMGFVLDLRTQLAQPWMEVRYEALIEDPRAQAAQIVKFLDLEWSEDVMRFTEHARNKWVRSPTYSDVASPVHSRAKGRWQHYAKYLEPFQDRLKEMLSRLGYS